MQHHLYLLNWHFTIRHSLVYGNAQFKTYLSWQDHNHQRQRFRIHLKLCQRLKFFLPSATYFRTTSWLLTMMSSWNDIILLPMVATYKARFWRVMLFFHWRRYWMSCTGSILFLQLTSPKQTLIRNRFFDSKELAFSFQEQSFGTPFMKDGAASTAMCNFAKRIAGGSLS